MEDYLKCNFCKQDFNTITKIPRMLKSCGHSICEECLIEYLQMKIPIRCEVDNNIIKTIKEDVENFPKNFALVQMLENSLSIKKAEKKKSLSSLSIKKERKSMKRERKSMIKKNNKNLLPRNFLAPSLTPSERERKNTEREERILERERKVLQRESILERERKNTEREEKSASILTDKKQIGKEEGLSEGSIKSLKGNIDKCEEHDKNAEIMCMNCSKKICYQCGLFGKHKNHQIIDYDKFLKEIETYRKSVSKKKKILENNEDFLNTNFITNNLVIPSKTKLKELSLEIDQIYESFFLTLKKSKKKAYMNLREIFRMTERNLKKRVEEELKKKNCDYIRVKKDIIYQLNKFNLGRKNPKIFCEIMKEKENLKIIEKADSVISNIKRKTRFWKKDIKNFLTNSTINMKKEVISDIIDINFQQITFEQNANLLPDFGFNSADLSLESLQESKIIDKSGLSFNSRQSPGLKKEYTKKSSSENNYYANLNDNYAKLNSSEISVVKKVSFEAKPKKKKIFPKNFSNLKQDLDFDSQNDESLKIFSADPDVELDISNIKRHKKVNSKSNFKIFDELQDERNVNSFNDYHYDDENENGDSEFQGNFLTDRVRTNEIPENKGSLKGMRRRRNKTKIDRKNTTAFSTFFEQNKKDISDMEKSFEDLGNYDKKPIQRERKISDYKQKNKEDCYLQQNDVEDRQGKYRTKRTKTFSQRNLLDDNRVLTNKTDRNTSITRNNFLNQNARANTNFRNSSNVRNERNSYQKESSISIRMERSSHNHYLTTDRNNLDSKIEKNFFVTNASNLKKVKKSQSKAKRFRNIKKKLKINYFKGKLKNIFKVDLSNLSLDKNCVYDLKEFLRNAKCIKILSLKNNFFTDQDLAEICIGLAYTKVKTLDLSGNKFTLNCISYITGMVEKNNYIKTIIFRDNVKREGYISTIIKEFNRNDVTFLV